MFCANCGQEAKEGTKFCRYCGAVLKKPVKKQMEMSSPILVDTVGEVEQEKLETGSKKKKGMKVVVGLGTGVAVAAVGFFIAGGFLCNSREYSIAGEIENYQIVDYVHQKEDLVSDYETYLFFDVVHKISSIQELVNVREDAKTADNDLKEQKKKYEQMDAEKEVYNLEADCYREYVNSLEAWRTALENKEYQKAVDAASEAKEKLGQLEEDNKTYVKYKLEQYAAVDWYGDDWETYTEDVERVKELLDYGKYSDIKPLFVDLDVMAAMQTEDEQEVVSDGPEEIVEQYVQGFVYAMTERNFSYIEDYLEPGSQIYNDQEKYVERGIDESLNFCEIESVNYKDTEHCEVTTYEEIYVKKTDKPEKLVTQRCKYDVVLTGGEWKISKMQIL